jgi:hypothetical protein
MGKEEEAEVEQKETKGAKEKRNGENQASLDRGCADGQHAGHPCFRSEVLGGSWTAERKIRCP